MELINMVYKILKIGYSRIKIFKTIKNIPIYKFQLKNISIHIHQILLFNLLQHIINTKFNTNTNVNLPFLRGFP